MMKRRLAATLALFGALSACDTGPITSTDPASAAGAITASDTAAAASSDAAAGAASRSSQDDDKGLVFNGNNFVDIAAPAELNEIATLTVEATIRGSQFGSNSWDSPIVSRHGSGTGWELRAGQAVPRFMVTTDGIHQYAEPDRLNRFQRLPLNQWVHLAGVYDTTSISLYMDGKLAFRTRRSPGRITSETGPITIGHNSEYRTRYFKGEIKQVSIWTKARTDAEIAADLATPPAKGPREGLFGHWDLTQVGSNGKIKDLAGSRDARLVSWY